MLTIRSLATAVSIWVALSPSIATAIPVADANGPYTVNEGSVVTLDGSGSSASSSFLVAYEWDLDDDGNYDDATGVTVSYSYPDGPLVRTVGLKVTDSNGDTNTDSSAVSVLNVAPVIDPIGNFYIYSGTLVDVLVTFDDPGGASDAPYAYVFDWGDGSPTATGSVASVTAISKSHTYAGSLGTVFTGSVTVTDKDGGVGGVLFSTEIVRSVPVPATLALLGIGLAGLGLARRRKAHSDDQASHGRSRRCFCLLLLYRKGNETMRRTLSAVAFAAAAILSPTVASAALLTDITVFSSNSEGNNWNGLIWNTQGRPVDGPLVDPSSGRWNLYVSYNPLSTLVPTFVNGYDDTRTQVSLLLAPGDNTFSIYGNGVGALDQRQHFVLNLYFNGNQTAPGISGLQNLVNDSLIAAAHPNGLSILGGSGAPEAGSLSVTLGNQLITLTAFSWITAEDRNVVWPYWGNDAPYSSAGGGPDYYGTFTLNVRAVPVPATLALLGIGLAGLGLARRRKAQ